MCNNCVYGVLVLPGNVEYKYSDPLVIPGNME